MRLMGWTAIFLFQSTNYICRTERNCGVWCNLSLKQNEPRTTHLSATTNKTTFYKHFRGHFAEKNGTRTDIYGHRLQKFGDNNPLTLSLHQQVRDTTSYINRISRHTCTTLGYIRLKIFGDNETKALSLPSKRRPTSDIFRQSRDKVLKIEIGVNLFNSLWVIEIAAAYFATIAERQKAPPWLLRHYLAAYILTGPREGQKMIRLRWVERSTHNPEVCAWFRNRLSNLCEANQCAGNCPKFTPMPMPVFKRNACGSYWHTYIIHTIADKTDHTDPDLCRFG